MDETHKDLDIVKTNRWLKSALLKVDIERLIIAAQDQSLPTKNYQVKQRVKANIYIVRTKYWVRWPLSVRLPCPNTDWI